MKTLGVLWFGAATILLTALASRGETKVVADHNDGSRATGEFKFKNVPSPSKDDAAAKAKFTIVAGTRDHAGADLDKLNDGRLPTEADQPSENFYFDVATAGGRLQADLGSAIEIRQVNTYSWHANTRAPQVYKLYASDGTAADFKAQPGRAAEPEKSGWKLIASVDTRPKEGGAGGQYGVSIFDDSGALGQYRYLLFDVFRTGTDDNFENTFYSEIDVLSGSAIGATQTVAAAIPPLLIKSADGKCDISIDTSGATDLKEWAETKLAPVLAEWFPKIVAMLPSEGYTAPASFSVTIRPGRGVAATSGTRVTANSNWLKGELDREAIGALLHEEIHVIQLYGRRGNRGEGGGRRLPGWLVEGIPDYIRWFLYEPQSHGADDVWMKKQKFEGVRYDKSYRQSANFLNWVSQKYDKDIVAKLNAAARAGKYGDEIWKEKSGQTAEELGNEWKAQLAKKLDIEWTPPVANSNTNNPAALAPASNTVTNK
ncbi:MAG TPA: basic secretory protein-like protein [Verrucomicrobiae bacterium]|nr:basic secretory protein-like protein [Verrucomicrobiae bacterium]